MTNKNPINNKKDSMTEVVSALSILFQLGITMIITILLSLFFGKYLDNVFNKDNLFTLVFLVLGVLAALRNMYVIIMGFVKNGKDNK